MFQLVSKASRQMSFLFTAPDASRKYTISLGDIVMDGVRSGQLLQFDDLAPATSYTLRALVTPRLCKLIRIHNNSKGDALSLAEVRAWGEDGTNRASARNGGVAWQTSTDYGGSANRAIDGKASGLWSHSSVTHTTQNPHQYWQVVLNPPSFIYSVVVFNRTDCCSDRLNGASLEIVGTDDELLHRETLNGDDIQKVLISP